MERKLAAILAADVVGYSKLMREDEETTLSQLKAHRTDLFDPKIDEHNGRIIKLIGDGTLVEFASIVDAVNCAIAIQSALADADGAIRLRIGINLGDIIVDGDDIYGDGVNVAARLEALAETGGICISDLVHQSIHAKIEASFQDMGEQSLKNIDLPVRTWHWPVSIAASDDDQDSVPDNTVDKPSIAVLPFTNMSGDPEQEYFSDGISEDIITELSRFRELFVIARNSSFSYKGKSTKVQDIGSDLGVNYVVEGSVRKAGQRIRITVQLVEAATGNHIWAERYDRELEDIFDLQDEITQTIVTVLPVRLQGALIENARKKPSENLSAYDYFLRARVLFDRTSGKFAEVLELLATAVKIDPNCAHAYALIADVHAYSVYTFSPIGDDPTIAALENVERALALGEGDHYIHSQAAGVYLTCGKHDLAQLHSDKALALNPNDINTLIGRGFIATYSGDHQKGVEQLKKALSHDPLAPDALSEDLAETYYLMRDYEKALEIYHRWQNPPVHMYTQLAACYAQLGRMDEARGAVRMFEERCPQDADFAFYAAAHVRICKRPEDAEHWFDGYRKAGLIV